MMVNNMLYYSTNRNLLTENDSYEERMKCALSKAQDIFDNCGSTAVNIKALSEEYHVNGTQLWQIWIENQK